MLQREALEILKTGSNVFLTGVPGAGKTYVINQYVDWLKDKGIFPAITASTGIASTHIGGQTIHSFSGIGVEKDIDQYKLDRILEKEKLVKKIQNTKVLIIDEISMLDAQTLENVDKVLRGIKNPEKAFGGVQIIFVGDFFQLPPVSKKGEQAKYFAFMGRAWKEAKPLVCYLEEQYRQADEVFTKLLMAIRENNVDEYHIEILEDLKKKTNEKFGLDVVENKGEEFLEEEIVIGDTDIDLPENSQVSIAGGLGVEVLQLHSHNKDVDSINEGKLTELSGKMYTYKMLTQGRASLLESLMKSCLSPETLKLKEGAKVIFTKNDLEGRYVNGTMGIVKDLDEFGIVVETKNGKLIDVKQEEWKYEDDGKVLARIMQYPLRLAWAITVHKSQGMSLDEAVVSLGETFEYGQGYVALSRLRSLEGLFLKSYNPKSLQVNPYISEFDEKIRKDSRFIQQKFKNAEKEKIEKLQKDFVKNSEGVWEGGVKREEKEFKKPTQEITLEFILSGKSISEISEERGVVESTILKHIEELYKKEKLNKQDLEKLAPEKINIFHIPNDVKKSFKKNAHQKDEEGNIKLGTVFKDLKEKYTYDELRWYRLVI